MANCGSILNETKYFIGRAKTAIDGKGRSSFPREFRRSLTAEDGTEFVVMKVPGPDHTLRLFVMSEYEKFMQELDANPDRKMSEEFRQWLTPSLVELDGQNRILLPRELLEYAGLKNEVLYTYYRGKSLQLWEPSKYEAIYAQTSEEKQKSFEDLYYSIGSSGGLNGKI